jgi:hypothetical protein
VNIERHFQFRGDRKYLQSASLFDDLIELRGRQAENIDFKFHRKTGNQVIYATDRPEDEQDIVAEWKDASERIFIIESDKPITNALPYDEPALVRRFALDLQAREIDIPADIGSFSRMESMVAGFKNLLQSVYPDVVQKYVFVRIRLKKLPQEGLTIRYSRDIGEFFQGDIRSGNEALGQIFFGVWK